MRVSTWRVTSSSPCALLASPDGASESALQHALLRQLWPHPQTACVRHERTQLHTGIHLATQWCCPGSDSAVLCVADPEPLFVRD